MSAEFVDGNTRVVTNTLYVNPQYEGYTDTSPVRVTLKNGRPADIRPTFRGFEVDEFPLGKLSSSPRLSRLAAQLGLVQPNTIYYHDGSGKELELKDGICVIPMTLEWSTDGVTPWDTVTRPKKSSP